MPHLNIINIIISLKIKLAFHPNNRNNYIFYLCVIFLKKSSFRFKELIWKFGTIKNNDGGF